MSECKYDDIKDYKSAFECFKQMFLVEKKSIFKLDKNNQILNDDSIKYLEENFINNGYEGTKEDSKQKIFNVTANEKFFRQLTGDDYSDDVVSIENEKQKNAIHVLAHAVWLWRLPASNTNTENRNKSVEEILSFNQEWQNKGLPDNKLFGQNYSGFAMPGIGYNTNKANELAYIIRWFEQWLGEGNDDNEEQIKFLKDTRVVKIKTTHKYYKEGNKYELDEIKEQQAQSKVSVPNALLHLMDSDNYEPIIADAHKEKIVKVFGDLIAENENSEKDEKIKAIKEKLKEKLKDGNVNFYSQTIKNLWLSEIDFESKNMILHGAPGTGKTYLTEESIKIRKNIFKNVEYELVQFHPNYDYEDFIEGIKPIGLQNGQMQFELKNGVFKKMCIDAFKELILAKKANEEPKKFYFIADEINRAELSRVFGELLLCLEDDKRLRFDGENLLGTKIKTQNASLWQKEHAVVILDEKDEEMYFGVPENLYFIGTMNDIDRSVDSFDMALRRRFVWKHYRCDYDVVFNHFADKNIDEDAIMKYIEVCKNLNEYIISEKGFNLGEEFELGHYYFMKPKNLTQTQIDKVWTESIEPLLQEYLRSIEDSSQIKKYLKESKNIFKTPSTTAAN